MRRVILAAAALGGWLATPGPAAACSGPMSTFEQLVSQSELIVEGRVTAVLLDGLAYELEVSEVFKGHVAGGRVRIGPSTDPGGRGCETTLEADSHVIIAVPDVDEVLNSLGTAVWHVGTDGSLSSTGGWWTLAADVADLREMLRHAVPDTALSPPKAAPLHAVLGWLLVYAALTLAAWRVTSGWRSMPGDRPMAESRTRLVNGPSTSGEFEPGEQRDRQPPGTQRPEG